MGTCTRGIAHYSSPVVSSRTSRQKLAAAMERAGKVNRSTSTLQAICSTRRGYIFRGSGVLRSGNAYWRPLARSLGSLQAASCKTKTSFALRLFCEIIRPHIVPLWSLTRLTRPVSIQAQTKIGLWPSIVAVSRRRTSIQSMCCWRKLRCNDRVTSMTVPASS